MTYAMSIIFWGVPYAVLAVGLFIWSRNQSAKKIYQAFYYSPILLAALIVIEMVSVDLYGKITGAFSSSWLSDGASFIWHSFLVSTLTLFFGYFAVVLGIAVYRLVDSLGLIKIESQSELDIPGL